MIVQAASTLLWLASAPPSAPPPPTPEPAPSTAGAPQETTTQSETKAVPSEQAIERQTDVDLDAEPKRKRYKPGGSPQRFEFEFKLGPYLPDVDRRHDGPGPGPYATIFGETNDLGVATGEPKVGVMPVLGFEWQFLYLAGPLGIGTQVGFFRDKADALLTNPPPDGNVRSGADEVKFGVVPIGLFAVYRFELLADRFKVPLVPYAKAGPAYAFWWSRDGAGEIAENADGEKGRGGVWGWQLNAGGMLRLDFIEPGTAKALDRTTGINHTYIFGEYQLSRLDNFGAGNSISVGDSTWFAGLAMEF